MLGDIKQSSEYTELFALNCILSTFVFNQGLRF